MSKIGKTIIGRDMLEMSLQYLAHNPLGWLLFMPSRMNSTMLEIMMISTRDGNFALGETKWCQSIATIFHTLCSKLGIKDFDRHLFLKYYNSIQWYIQIDMELLDISSVEVAYWYAIKIEQEFK